MKPLLKLPAFFLLPIAIHSCTSKQNNFVKETIDPYYKYAVVINLKNTEELNNITTDTTFLFEKEDSAAYLKGKIKFREYTADWNLGKKAMEKEPLSFKVLNEKGEAIGFSLSAMQTKKADSSVKQYIQNQINARYSISDNVQSLDNINKEKIVTDTADTKKANKARQQQLYTRGGKYTYSPI